MKAKNTLAIIWGNKIINKPFFQYNSNDKEEKYDAIKIIESGMLSKILQRSL